MIQDDLARQSDIPSAGRGSSVEKIAPFLALENLKPFIDEELASSTFPLIFQTVTGSKAYGYKAELLPKVCTVYLKARDAGVLLKSQLRFAYACDILIRGLAETGIVALVDEATGYQEIRDKLALQEILDTFLKKEFAAWAHAIKSGFGSNGAGIRKIGLQHVQSGDLVFFEREHISGLSRHRVSA